MRFENAQTWIYFFLLVVILSACSKEIKKRTIPFEEIIPGKDVVRISLEDKKQNDINVLYMGCGHLLISYREQNFIVDPFFSVSPFTRKIVQSDTSLLPKYKAIASHHKFNLNLPATTWIAHSHYDHLMDLPLLLEREVFPKSTSVYGNSYGKAILENVGFSNLYQVIDSSVIYNPKKNSSIDWVQPLPSVRVLPIESDHAPHYKFWPIRIHLMKGKLNESYFKNNYKTTTSPTKRNQWKEGKTYSFLVDFMNEDKIEYRFFIQTSGSTYPMGRPPIPLPDNRDVDVAFLCLASANYVSPYPVDLLKEMQPEKIVFIHWEDFFGKPLEHDDARLVRLTNFRRVNRRLKRNKLAPAPEKYLMPRPGTLIKVNPSNE